MADQTNAGFILDQLNNRLLRPMGNALMTVGNAVTPANPKGGAPVAAPAPAAAPPVTVTAPTIAPARPVPAPAVVPSVTDQLNAQDAKARAFVAGLPTYQAPAAAPAPAVAAPRPVGASRAPAGGGGGGGGGSVAVLPAGMRDPSDAIATGYNQQVAYMNTALDAIKNAASQGDPRNYSFRLAHLSGALANNNFGSVQGQGIDALNSALAGIQNANTYAGAQIQSAGINAGAQNAMTNALMERFYSTPVQAGADVQYLEGPNGQRIPMMNSPTYAVPTRGGGFQMINPQGARTDQHVVGKAYKDKNGNVAVYQSDGTFKPVGK